MAAKKPFRLHTVLRYRQQLEDRRKEEFARLIQAVADAEGTLVRQQQQREDSLQALHRRQQTGLPAAELSLYSAFLQQLAAEMAQQTQVIARLRQATEEARQRLEQAMKERKMLENLQDKARVRERQQVLRDEERTLAEIALRQFGPKNVQRATYDVQR